MDLQHLLNDTSAALEADTVEVMREFIEKWIPEITNEISTLRNANNFLELELSEARSALED